MRRKRDFQQHEPALREWLLNHTWCEKCAAADLGMDNPHEYEEDGILYIEGNCLKCGSIVRATIEVKDVR